MKNLGELRRHFNLKVGQIRSVLLRLVLGKSVTVFVTKLSSGYYEVEVADSQRRIRLLVSEVQQVTSKRFRLMRYR